MSRCIEGSWLKAFVSHTRNSESPDRLRFWVGVWTVAGALRRKCWIDMGHFVWTPNFYIVLVAPPGVATKSTIGDAGQSLLAKVKNVHFGPASSTWQALGEAFSEARRSSKLPEPGETITHSSLNIFASELGTFFDASDAKMIDVLTDFWDGKVDREFRHKTRTQAEIRIQNPWLNLLACTTPSWLQQYLPRYSIGGGFTSRCIFVYASRKERLIAYPDEMVEKDKFNAERSALLQDLQEIGNLTGQFTLDREARDLGRAWYESFHSGEVPPHLQEQSMEGYKARKQTQVHKVAMVISASESNSKVITRKHLEWAFAMVEDVERDMAILFRMVGGTVEGDHLKQIEHLLRLRRGGMPLKKLLEAMITQVGTYRRFKELIYSGIEAGLFVGKKINNEDYIILTENFRKELETREKR